MAKLSRVIYCSRSVIPDEPEVQKAELARILEVARRNNARKEITGALLFTKGCFAQALEGELYKLEATLANIERDPRHENITCMEWGPIDERAFSNWAMAFASKRVADNPLVGQAIGDVFTGVSASAEELLSFLRQGIYRIPKSGP